ncbi:hypothetical protein BKA63DRAFT_497431 [Paraphoma chrysanthemicola]|nr:hypothetical protein BKA63DRAFT_497431 [Paraphoma chrysanthemicola]
MQDSQHMVLFEASQCGAATYRPNTRPTAASELRNLRARPARSISRTRVLGPWTRLRTTPQSKTLAATHRAGTILHHSAAKDTNYLRIRCTTANCRLLECDSLALPSFSDLVQARPPSPPSMPRPRVPCVHRARPASADWMPSARQGAMETNIAQPGLDMSALKNGHPTRLAARSKRQGRKLLHPEHEASTSIPSRECRSGWGQVIRRWADKVLPGSVANTSARPSYMP